MSFHNTVAGKPGPAARSELTAALCGNPNVGKSTLFNALTGLRQHTGNWPGKTVAMAEGRFSTAGFRCTLVDLPGTYSLASRSPEEEVTREYICSRTADVIVVICDATCLERNLTLVLQVLNVTPGVIVCLNLMDEASRKGIHIDSRALSEALDAEVVCVTARNKRSLRPLLDAIDRIGDAGSERPRHAVRSPEEIEQTARALAASCIRQEEPEPFRTDLAVDRVLTGRRWGYPLMLLGLCAVLWLTIKGANAPSALLSKALFSLGDALYALFCRIGVSQLLRDALIFGVWRVLAWVISVMLPPMAIFFPLFTLLEDLGYLPRVAFNLDKPFRQCRACGKQALTMSMGLGCNSVGVTGCRIIDSPRERLLAILTNSLVPCNGRFPILISLLTVFFSSGSSLLTALLLTALLLVGILTTFAMTKLLSSTVLKGEPSSFTLELPPYRRPQIGQVIVRSVLDRTLFVLGRAAAVAAPAGLLLWILSNICVGGESLLSGCAAYLDPAGRLLGMDGAILLAFLLGWPANETVIPILLMIYLSAGRLTDGTSDAMIGAILKANGWTWTTAGSVLLFTLMHWPCSTTVLTVYRETRSLKWTLLSILLPTGCGAAACLLFRAAVSIFCR